MFIVLACVWGLTLFSLGGVGAYALYNQAVGNYYFVFHDFLMYYGFFSTGVIIEIAFIYLAVKFRKINKVLKSVKK